MSHKQNRVIILAARSARVISFIYFFFLANVEVEFDEKLSDPSIKVVSR